MNAIREDAARTVDAKLLEADVSQAPDVKDAKKAIEVPGHSPASPAKSHKARAGRMRNNLLL